MKGFFIEIWCDAWEEKKGCFSASFLNIFSSCFNHYYVRIYSQNIESITNIEKGWSNNPQGEHQEKDTDNESINDTSPAVQCMIKWWGYQFWKIDSTKFNLLFYWNYRSLKVILKLFLLFNVFIEILSLMKMRWDTSFDLKSSFFSFIPSSKCNLRKKDVDHQIVNWRHDDHFSESCNLYIHK